MTATHLRLTPANQTNPTASGTRVIAAWVMMAVLAGLITGLLPVPARAADAADFTVVVLPDTQYYSKEWELYR